MVTFKSLKCFGYATTLTFQATQDAGNIFMMVIWDTNEDVPKFVFKKESIQEKTRGQTA